MDVRGLKQVRGLALACLAVASAPVALAADDAGSPWSVYAGAGMIRFHPQAEVSAGGVVVPGGGAQASTNHGVAFGVLYALAPGWSAELALGVPPTTTLSGAGTLASAGKLGTVTYAPAVLSLRRALPALGPVQPYLGAGLNYTAVLKTTDAFVQDLQVRNAWGGVAQLGALWPLGGAWSVGLDMKKVWVRSTATGTLPAMGGVDSRTRVRLDPVISSLSLHYAL